jgi:hypothetical protein
MKNDLDQLAYDRHEAAKRQGDMFPDIYQPANHRT